MRKPNLGYIYLHFLSFSFDLRQQPQALSTRIFCRQKTGSSTRPTLASALGVNHGLAFDTWDLWGLSKLVFIE